MSRSPTPEPMGSSPGEVRTTPGEYPCPTMAAKTTIEAPTLRDKRSKLTTLSVLYAGGEGIVQRESLLLRGGTVHVGRALEGKAGIDLPEDGLASRVHATIDHDARHGTTRIVDLGSRNGLKVNGSRQAEVLLEDGDVIQIGESLLMLRTVDQGEPKSTIPGLLGRSPAVQRLRNDLLRVGAADATVLLLGESGTGKEVAARSLHRASGRSGPFVAVNCSAFPPSLVESQLFGHRAGAFTGATRQHDGFFRSAEGGTLFLDEIGDLPEEQQPKLLRALEERGRRFARVRVGPGASADMDSLAAQLQ